MSFDQVARVSEFPKQNCMWRGKNGLGALHKKIQYVRSLYGELPHPLALGGGSENNRVSDSRTPEWQMKPEK